MPQQQQITQYTVLILMQPIMIQVCSTGSLHHMLLLNSIHLLQAGDYASMYLFNICVILPIVLLAMDPIGMTVLPVPIRAGKSMALVSVGAIPGNMPIIPGTLSILIWTTVCFPVPAGHRSASTTAMCPLSNVCLYVQPTHRQHTWSCSQTMRQANAYQHAQQQPHSEHKQARHTTMMSQTEDVLRTAHQLLLINTSQIVHAWLHVLLITINLMRQCHVRLHALMLHLILLLFCLGMSSWASVLMTVRELIGGPIV